MPVLGTIDIGGDGQEVLLASLNYVLGTTFTLDDFEFSEPASVSIPAPTHNTVVKFGPKAHSGYYGVKRIYYNRVHVSELGPISVPRGIATRISHLLPVINSKYGILIKVEDIYDADLPDPAPGEVDVEVLLDFRPTSLVFYGGAMIVAGTNDPAIGDGDGITLPFEPTWMFFAENIHDEVLDAYSVSIDRDKTRRRTANTIDDTSDDKLGLVYQRNILDSEFSGGYFGHIVGCWSGSSQNQAFALNIYGHVMQRTPNGKEWSTVADIGGVNMLNMAEVNDAQTDKKFHTVAQDTTGTVYVLRTNDDEVLLQTSGDYGLTWSDVELQGVFTILNPLIWQSGILSVLDIVATSANVYLVVHQHELGNGKLSLYEIELSTGNVEEFNLGTVAIRNTGNFIRPSDKDGGARACFVSTGLSSFTHPSFAVLTSTGSAANMQALMFNWDAPSAMYVPEATGVADLYPDQVNYPGSFISAYTVDMTKTGDFSVQVVEIGTMLESEEPDYETFKKRISTVRTEKKFYNHGIIVMTRVKVANFFAPWYSQKLHLYNGSYPQRMIFNDIHRRAHYIIQPESGLYRLSFIDNDTDKRVEAALDDNLSISLPMHSGYRNHSTSGLGKYTNSTILETANTNYNAGAYSDAEAAKDNIGYSFSAIDSTGNFQWLVSTSTSNPLVKRNFAREYNFMGTTPVAMFSSDDEYYVLTDGNRGVYKFDTTEKKWSFIGSLQAIIYDERNDNLIGWNNLQLNPSNIVGFNKKSNGTIQLHVKINREVKVTEFDDSTLAKPLTVVDEAIISIRSDQLVGYDNNLPFLYKKINNVENFGFNPLSDVSPREFKTVAFTTTGNMHHNGVYTDTVDYDTPDTNITLPVGFPTDVDVLDYRSEVEFMELQGIYYLKQQGAEKYWLAFHHDDGTMTTQDLFGGDDPIFASFKPTHVFFLYEYMDANYVPIIYYSANKILLINSFVEDGTFAITSHNLSIPGNNGSGLRVVPVLSSNRSEKLFAQKNNGIFKLTYAKNPTTRVVTFTLTKIFDLSLQYQDYEVYTSCVTSYDTVVQPDESYIPPWPANGTLLSTFCDDVTLMGVFADGDGGTYVDIVEQNNIATCGYVPPDPASLDPGAVTITASLISSDTTIITPTAIATEGGTEAYATFLLDSALLDDAHLNVTLEYLTADAGDIDTIKYQIDEGAKVTVSLNDVTPYDLLLPAGTESFKFYFTFVADELREEDEEFKLILSIPLAETHIANGADIKAVFRILDSSTPMPYPPVESLKYLDDFEADNKSFGAIVPGNLLTHFYNEYNSVAGSTAVNYGSGKLTSTNINPAVNKFAELFTPDGLGDGYKDLRFTFDFSITKSIVNDDSSDPVNLDFSNPLPVNHTWNITEIGFFLVNENKSDQAGEQALYVKILTDASVGGVSFAIDAVDGSEGQLDTTSISSVVATTQTVFNSLRRGAIKLDVLFFGADADRRLKVLVNDTELFTKKIANSIAPLGDKYVPVINLAGANINEAYIKIFKVVELLPEPEVIEVYNDNFVTDNKSFTNTNNLVTDYYKEINNANTNITEVEFDADKLKTTDTDPDVVKMWEHLTVKNYATYAKSNVQFIFDAFASTIIVDDSVSSPAVAKAINWNASLGPTEHLRDTFIHVYFINTAAVNPGDKQAVHLKFGSQAINNAIVYEINEVSALPGFVGPTAISNVIPITLSAVAMPKGGAQKYDVQFYRDDALHRRMRLIVNNQLVFDRVFDSSKFPLEHNYVPVISLQDANWNELHINQWLIGDMANFAPPLTTWPAAGLPYVIDFIGDNGNYGLIQPGNTIVEFFDDLADVGYDYSDGLVEVEFTAMGLRVERQMPIKDNFEEVLAAREHSSREAKNISLVLDVGVENIEVYDSVAEEPNEVPFSTVLSGDQEYQEEELVLYLLNQEDDDSNGKRSISVTIKTAAERTGSTIQAKYVHYDASTNSITSSLIIESPQALGSMIPVGGGMRFELYTAVDGGNRRGYVKLNGTAIHNFLIESTYAGINEKFTGAVSMNKTNWSRFQIKRFEVTDNT